MKTKWRLAAIAAVAALMFSMFGSSPGMAQSRAHVYLLRGLMNIFSLGMDELADKLKRHGVYATVHNHSEWESLADGAAERYKAGKEGPIILIGHSLGADAVMEMAAYLDKKGVPVALVVPFDGTQSFPTPKNVGRLVNLTQRDYAYMRRGPGFHGSLANVDLSGDPGIDHLSIDKSPRLHARVISEVLAVIGSGHHVAAPAGSPKPGAAKPASNSDAKPEGSAEPAIKSANGAPATDGATPTIAAPERRASGGAAVPSH
jgi:hypothetical protein